MTDKAYIVANEEQEREVLIDLENQGYVWNNFIKSKPTTMTYQDIDSRVNYPYVLYANDDTHKITWGTTGLLNDTGIIYDGRKESKMKISKEVYDALVEWKLDAELNHLPVYTSNLTSLPVYVRNWWRYNKLNYNDKNNRLIAIIRWVNGEDMFEVEKPKKWIVRSKNTDNTGDYGYVSINQYNIAFNAYHIISATKFDSKEEAESWANAHQEVIEVEA